MLRATGHDRDYRSRGSMLSRPVRWSNGPSPRSPNPRSSTLPLSGTSPARTRWDSAVRGRIEQVTRGLIASRVLLVWECSWALDVEWVAHRSSCRKVDHRPRWIRGVSYALFALSSWSRLRPVMERIANMVPREPCAHPASPPAGASRSARRTSCLLASSSSIVPPARACSAVAREMFCPRPGGIARTTSLSHGPAARAGWQLLDLPRLH